MSKVLSAQVFLVLVVVAFAGWVAGGTAATAAAFGGSIAMVNAVLMRRRMKAAEKYTGEDHTAWLPVYMGAVERMVVALVLFGTGLGFLGLSPLPMLAAFAIAQSCHVLGLREHVMGEPAPQPSY